jgi:hypothetical protein
MLVVIPLVGMIRRRRKTRLSAEPAAASTNRAATSSPPAGGITSELISSGPDHRAVEVLAETPTDLLLPVGPSVAREADASAQRHLPEEKVGRRRGSVTSIAMANDIKSGFGLVTGPITARALGPVGQGSVAAVSVYNTITTTLFSFGLPNATGYFAVKRTYARRALMGATFRISLMLMPVIAIAAFAVVSQ